MFSNKKTISIIVAILAIASTASASVFLGGSSELKSSSFATRRSSCRVTNFYRQRSIDTENQRYQIARSIRRHTSPNTNGAAMAIPGMWFAFFDVSTLRLLARLGICFWCWFSFCFICLCNLTKYSATFFCCSKVMELRSRSLLEDLETFWAFTTPLLPLASFCRGFPKPRVSDCVINFQWCRGFFRKKHACLIYSFS